MPSTVPHRSYRNTGLLALPPYKSSVTQQEIRFTTLAGRYASRSTISPASWGPTSSPQKSFNGILALQSPPMQFSSQDANTQREFPAEMYVQVKRHVKHMMEHPCEKTLRYKVNRVQDLSRAFIRRSRRNIARGGRAILVPLCRYWQNRGGRHP